MNVLQIKVIIEVCHDISWEREELKYKPDCVRLKENFYDKYFT